MKMVKKDAQLAALIAATMTPEKAAYIAEAQAHHAAKPNGHVQTGIPGITAKVSIVYEVEGLEGYTDDGVKVRPHDTDKTMLAVKCKDPVKLMAFIQKSGMKVVQKPVKGNKHFIAFVKKTEMAPLMLGPTGQADLLGIGEPVKKLTAKVA